MPGESKYPVCYLCAIIIRRCVCVCVCVCVFVHLAFLHSLLLDLSPCRFQCGDGGVQEYQFYRVGCGWTGQDPTPVETLLPKHTGYVYVYVRTCALCRC